MEDGQHDADVKGKVLAERLNSSIKGKDQVSVREELTKLGQVAWMVRSSTPFNLTDDESFREWMALMLGVHSVDGVVPHRDSLSTKYLETLYACVLVYEMKKLHEAEAFGVTFDAWSSRRKRTALVSVTYHFVDRSFQPYETVLDAIPTSEGQTALNLAVRAAHRIEARTLDDQILYTATTDNANNVRTAARYIVDRFTALQELEVHEEGAAVEEAETLLAFDDDCEPERAVGCVAHAVNLAVNSLLSMSGVDVLVKKVTAIVATYGHSTKRQKTLSDIQVLLKRRPKVLVSYTDTCWNSLKRCIARFCELYDVLLCAWADGVFDAGFTAATGEPELAFPDRIELEVLKAIVKLLEPVEAFSTFLQGGRYFTTSHTLYFFDRMIEQISEVSLLPTLPHGAQMRDTLCTSLKDRMAPLRQPGPLMLAALVHPVQSRYTCESADSEALKGCFEMLVDWYMILLAENEADTRARKARSIWAQFRSEGLVGVSKKAEAEEAVIRLLDEIYKYSDNLKGTLLPQKLDITKPLALDDAVRDFFVGLPTRQAQLCRIVLAGVVPSGASQRVFSASDLVDSALQDQLSPTKIEMMTVVQCFLRRHPDDGALDHFWKCVADWLLDEENGIPALEDAVNKLKTEL
jgi:hypothetical protein